MAAFVETRIVPEARWPNDNGSYPWPTYAFCTAAGYDKDGKNGWIADTHLPERPDEYWKGCRLIVLAGHGWRGRDLPIVHYVSAQKKIITDFENNLPGAPGNATLRGPVPRKQLGQEPFKGNEYFLVADPAELANPGLWIQNECDAPNEWAYHFDKTNPEKSRLYFKTAGAPPSNVELRVRDVGSISGRPARPGNRAAAARVPTGFWRELQRRCASGTADDVCGPSANSGRRGHFH